MIPDGPYLELFGRVHNQRNNWVTVGNESINFKQKIKTAQKESDKKRKQSIKLESEHILAKSESDYDEGQE